MGNRFLKIKRKSNKPQRHYQHDRPYASMTHEEVVSEMRYLLDSIGVQRLPHEAKHRQHPPALVLVQRKHAKAV